MGRTTHLKNSRIYQGFTLIELLVVVGLMAIVASITIPISITFIDRNNVDVTMSALRSSLRTAQTYSVNMKEDDGWGVHVSSGLITIYKGNNYSSRDPQFDQKTDVSTEVFISGISDVSFSKEAGIPSTTGIYTLTVGSGYARNVFIQSNGFIDGE